MQRYRTFHGDFLVACPNISQGVDVELRSRGVEPCWVVAASLLGMPGPPSCLHSRF